MSDDKLNIAPATLADVQNASTLTPEADRPHLAHLHRDQCDKWLPRPSVLQSAILHMPCAWSGWPQRRSLILPHRSIIMACKAGVAKFDDEHGMWFGDEYDHEVFNNCRTYFKHFKDHKIDMEDKIVLDLGAYRGFFAKMAMTDGARKVICVEPSRQNFEILKLNTKASSYTKLHGAVVGFNCKTVELLASKRQRRNSSFHITRKTAQQEVVDKVKAYDFVGLIGKFSPPVIKMDIEGAEWSIFRGLIPPPVKVMIGEIHYNSRYMLDETARSPKPLKDKTWTEGVLGNLKSQGFELHFKQAGTWKKAPPYASSFWHQDFIFIRN